MVLHPFISRYSLSDLQKISVKVQLGALSWGRDGKIGGLVLGLFSSVMLLQILHGLGYLDNKQWNFNAFKNLGCP